ncbi:MAG: MFS transporter [Thermoleophilia bacterium]
MDNTSCAQVPDAVDPCPQVSSARHHSRHEPLGTWGISIEANPAVGTQSTETPTRTVNFALLWAGQFVSQMGDRLAMVAFPWLVYKSTGSAVSTGGIFALYTLPYVLFGAFAGVLIDRFNKRTVMVVADVLRFGLVLLVPWAAQWSLPAVYVLSFLMASAAVFFDPSKLAIVPDIVPRDKLMRANSLLSTGENLTEVVGYGLAGITLSQVSTTTAFRIDGATFLVSAVALIAMRYRAPLREAAERVGESFWSELREGMRYLEGHQGLRANTVITLAAAAGAGASYPLTFMLAVRVLNGGTQAFGLFEGALGLGYLAGSVVLVVLARRVPKGIAMTAGFAATGAGISLVGVCPSVWTAAIPFLAIGMANAVALIAVDTYLQEVVPERLRGRVWGTRFTLTQGTYAISVLAGGALAGVFDVRALFIVSGVLIALPAIAGLFVREIREA